MTMTLIELARKLRPLIEKAAQSLSDEDALEAVQLYPAWAIDKAYETGERVQDEGLLYRCVQSHTSQVDWKPGVTPALWTRVDNPAEEWPEWRQPAGAHDAYAAGAKVSHNGKHWINNVDHNSYEPGVYGWTEVT